MLARFSGKVPTPVTIWDTYQLSKAHTKRTRIWTGGFRFPEPEAVVPFIGIEMHNLPDSKNRLSTSTIGFPHQILHICSYWLETQRQRFQPQNFSSDKVATEAGKVAENFGAEALLQQQGFRIAKKN